MEEMHEAHFYHEESLPTQNNSPLIYEKGNFHLNLHADMHQNPRLEQIRRNNIPSEISSPDFGILKLASPDLEKMLLAFQSGNNESPSTTHVSNSATIISNEQLHVTKGLPEVLQELHDRQETNELKTILPQPNTGSFIDETVSANDQLYLTTDANGVITVASSLDKFTNSQNYNVIATENNTEKQLNQTYALPGYPTSTLLPNTTAQLYTTPLRHPTENHEAANQLRALSAYNNVLATNSAFPSQVFKLDSSGIFADNSSSLQPIDLEMQEMVKRERKKQRNRVASSKCRKRKLEKEAVLETTVKDLRARNVELSSLANALKQQICDLKQKVMDHVTEGCPITLHNVEDPNELYSEGDWGSFNERT